MTEKNTDKKKFAVVKYSLRFTQIARKLQTLVIQVPLLWRLNHQQHWNFKFNVSLWFAVSWVANHDSYVIFLPLECKIYGNEAHVMFDLRN